MKMSLKGFRLLSELDLNSRKSYSKIGKKIKMSQQMISYNVNSYLNEGIINGFYPIINYSTLGYQTFRVFFKINYISRKRFSELVQNILKNENIIEVIECSGKYDLILVFAAKNPSNFNKVLKDIISENPEHLKRCDILTTIVMHLFNRKYLVPNFKVSHLVIGGDKEIIRAGRRSKKILFELMKDGRANSVKIANELKTSPKTIISRIKRLSELRIIKGFGTLMDVSKIGYHTHKILLQYHKFSIEKETELLNFCKSNSNITEFIKLFGEWDIEITVETKKPQEFRNVYMSIRENFEEIIRDFNDFPVLKVYKKQFLPNSFFYE